MSQICLRKSGKKFAVVIAAKNVCTEQQPDGGGGCIAGKL